MRKDCEVWDASHVEADRQFRIALGVNLNYDSPSGHVSGRTRDLGRCHTARPAPRGPEIHQHRDAGVRDDFVEQLGIHFERFVYRGHGGFNRRRSDQYRQDVPPEYDFFVRKPYTHESQA